MLYFLPGVSWVVVGTLNYSTAWRTGPPSRIMVMTLTMSYLHQSLNILFPGIMVNKYLHTILVNWK